MNKLLPLVVIVGPTAVGKTQVGVNLAASINGEVISGDSMQIYKKMDIGTAKPELQEIGEIPHFMIDIINPDQEFSTAIFQHMVEELITDINGKGKVPILVGGTGLYVNSVLNHYDFTPPAGDKTKREELYNLANKQGNEHLLRLLQEVDPVSAARIHQNDTRRLVRALEVYYTVGKPISDFQYNNDQMPPKYNLAYFGLNMDRQHLYSRIEQRVDLMISRGLVEEVRNLLKMGYGLHNPAMQAIGYKEIIDYLEGRSSLAEAILLIKQETRRFAKRQLTWFRRDNRITWKHVEDYDSLVEIADEIAQSVEGQFSKM